MAVKGARPDGWLEGPGDDARTEVLCTQLHQKRQD